MELPTRSEGRGFNTDAPFIPTSPMEIFLAALLCTISVVVVAYTMVVLYRCICTRNYAEWRASWHQQEKASDSVTQLVLEAVPMVLEGHVQEVECIATDGNTVASSCLSGHIRVWDIISGEQLAHVDRRQFFSSPQKDLTNSAQDQDELMSDYESGSPPSRGEMEIANSHGFYSSSPASHKRKSSPGSSNMKTNEKCINKRHSMGNTSESDYQIYDLTAYKRKSLNQTFDLPDLKPAINTKFSSMKHSSLQKNYDQGFDYGDQYKQIFEEHKKLKELQMCDSIEQGNQSISKVNLTDSVGSLTTDKAIQISQLVPQIWCMDYQENLIVVGCSNGTLEFWEGTTGRFKVIFINIKIFCNSLMS